MSDTNKIIEAISMKLDKVFNKKDKKYTIYGEDEVKQGLEEPCFFIKTLNPGVRQIVGSRYFSTQPFDIHYFPQSSIEAQKEMLDIAGSLYEALEYIDYEDDMFRGVNMDCEIIDNVLHFFVDYNYYFIRKKEEDEYIENLEYFQEVRDEQIE